jgi:uncharacterized membrane protein HdeD (DUF308 family)
MAAAGTPLRGSPLREQGRVLLSGATRYWWVVVATGVAWLVVAWVVLRADVRSLATVGVLTGAVLVAAAVNEAAMVALVARPWKVLYGVLAVLFLLTGLWGFIRPVDTFFALASALGLVLVFYGAFEVSRAIASRGESPYWWVGLVSGVLLLLLALWVSSSDPEQALARRTLLILFWVGAMALLRGIAQITAGLGMRHVHHDLDPGRSDATGPADVRGAVPAQDRREPDPGALRRTTG